MNEAHERIALYLADEANDEAVLAAARRIIDRRFLRHGVISNPEDAAEMFRTRLAGETREVMIVLYLDNMNQVLAVKEVSLGTLQSCTVHPRELAREALRFNAASIILAHNHPSGSSVPSIADQALTDRVKQVLELIEVKVLDHLVIGATVTSMASRGML